VELVVSMSGGYIWSLLGVCGGGLEHLWCVGYLWLVCDGKVEVFGRGHTVWWFWVGNCSWKEKLGLV
jgi:hypothetical protein